MKTTGTYGPEDLEYLLANKRFDELYPEEKVYVLNHIDNETEYDELRNILLKMEEPDLVDIAPSPRMRENLMNMHRAHHNKPSFKIWLNSLFSGFSLHDLVRKPAFQIATVACILLLGFWVMPSKKSIDLAEKPTISRSIESQAEEQIDLNDKEFSEEEPTVELQYEDDSARPIELEVIEEARSKEDEMANGAVQLNNSENYLSDEMDEISLEVSDVLMVEAQTSDSDVSNDVQLDMVTSTYGKEDLERESMDDEASFSASPASTEAIKPTKARKLAQTHSEANETDISSPSITVGPDIIDLLYTSW